MYNLYKFNIVKFNNLHISFDFRFYYIYVSLSSKIKFYRKMV